MPHPKPEHDTVIHIDNRPYKVAASTLTVNEILRLRFGEQADLSSKLLTLREGNDVHEYPNQGEAISIVPALHFVVLDTSPTTVS